MSDLLENPKLTNVIGEFYDGVSEITRIPIVTLLVSLPVDIKKVLVVESHRHRVKPRNCKIRPKEAKCISGQDCNHLTQTMEHPPVPEY